MHKTQVEVSKLLQENGNDHTLQKRNQTPPVATATEFMAPVRPRLMLCEAKLESQGSRNIRESKMSTKI